MERDFDTMRAILAITASMKRPARHGDFIALPEPAVKTEFIRLPEDGFIDSSIAFLDGDGICLGGEVTGLTDEGARFLKLIENDAVWAIVKATLVAANVDVPYPLLKDVCEEIVKRYVTSFIPDIRRHS